MDNNQIRILIAEKVMDWERWTCKDFGYKEAVLMPPGTNMGATWRKCGADIALEPNGAAGVPDYPNDLLAAFQVAETIEKRFECTINIQIRPKRINKVWTGERWERNRYAVTVEGGELEYDNFTCSFTVYDEELCVAICQAALKAVGVEVDGANR